MIQEATLKDAVAEALELFGGTVVDRPPERAKEQVKMAIVVKGGQVRVTSQPQERQAGQKSVLEFEGMLSGVSDLGENVGISARFTLWPNRDTGVLDDDCRTIAPGDCIIGYAKQGKPYNNQEQWSFSPDFRDGKMVRGGGVPAQATAAPTSAAVAAVMGAPRQAVAVGGWTLAQYGALFVECESMTRGLFSDPKAHQAAASTLFIAGSKLGPDCLTVEAVEVVAEEQPPVPSGGGGGETDDGVPF